MVQKENIYLAEMLERMMLVYKKEVHKYNFKYKDNIHTHTQRERERESKIRGSLRKNKKITAK